MGDETNAMKPGSREQAVFAEALQRDSLEVRAAYLEGACGTDTALRRRVDALLRAVESAGDFLEQPPEGLGGGSDSPSLVSQLSEKPGTRIGRYKLLEKIGEGGCGVVYMAEQEEPVRRRVALKVIKLGMDTRSVIARFEAERQALAMMDHPNIAKVFDGGATQTGRPYFVMELVRGMRITEFCDEARLSTEARLGLFVQVCQAVQHAHQKGIIHRDLKPSNILVTVNDGVPVPKVIDFGIAKATGERLTDKTLFTQFHSFIGTPAYTSPEQAELSSVDIDTRTDIYSLGVLLYELLTGRTPFDGEELLRSGLDEMRRIIRETDPPRPSTRLTHLVAADKGGRVAPRAPGAPGVEVASPAIGVRGATRPTKELISAVRGDLDWIVMKCLEKDRARRYETANGIAADVRRHLESEPILARPPSRLYRFRKLVRRNRVTFTAIAAVALTLLAGLTVSTWQAIRAQRGEARANTALADLRASAPAYAAQARGLAARGQFAEAIEKLDYAIQLRPDSTEYLLAKGNLLECQLQFAEAAPVYGAALRLDPGDIRAQTNFTLCEQLRSLDRAQVPQWNDTLAGLYVVMTREQRPEAEMKRISGLVLDYASKRLGALEIFAGHSIEARLALFPYGLLDLDLNGTPIVDLSLLQGLPLGRVNVAGTAVTDLRPLKSLPVKALNIAGTRTINLEPLRGMQTIVSLSLEYSDITNLSPLQGLPVRWLNLTGTRVADLSPLRGMPLGVLRLRNTPVADLTPLAGMPLVELDCTSIPAMDFSALADCPALTSLFLSHTAVKELEVLRGCKLVILRIDQTAVRDLSPLAGMPLHTIRFFDTDVTDVTPLLQCPTLQDIGLSRGVRNVALLRALPNLRRISYDRDDRGGPAQTAAEFWKAWDTQSEGKK